MRPAIVLKWMVLIGLPIIMWRCYWYVGFNQEYTKLLNFILSFILLVVVVTHLVRRKCDGYDRYVKWIIILFLISLATSFFYWGQSPVLTFRAGVSVLTILYFFVLKKYKVTEQELFKLVLIFSGIYVVLWFYALSQAPSIVFGNLEGVSDYRGFYRIVQLASLDTVCLLYFLSLVRAITLRKTIWFLLCIGCFLVIFLDLTRMLIASVLVVSALFILRKRFFLAIMLSVLLVICYNQLLSNKIVSQMINMTETQIDSQDQRNLRIVEYGNAFSAFPFHVGTTIFGNGAAHVDSNYGKYNEDLKYNKKFHLEDAGYVGLYINYGIVMLILFALLLLKVARDKVPIQFEPYRLFVYTLYITNITSYEFWAQGVSFAISLYALSIANIKHYQ